ncbi:LysE family transporter [Thorsellia kenyensis]|uniref:LysE family transporter n=1 Tax=Thorsellia kenyensis TaxID=1549888 RepID=A0ABV6C896_9GAMM
MSFLNADILLTIAVVHFLALMTPGPDFLYVSQTAMSRSKLDAMKSVLGIVLGVAFWASITLLGMYYVFEKVTWLAKVIQLLGGFYLLWLGYLLIKVPSSRFWGKRNKTTKKLNKSRKELRDALILKHTHLKSGKENFVNEESGNSNDALNKQIECNAEIMCHAVDLNSATEIETNQSNPTETASLAVKQKNPFIYGLLTNLSNPKVVIYFGSVFSPFLNGQQVVTALLKWELLFLITIETFLWFSIVAFLFGVPSMQKTYQRYSIWIDGLAGLFFAAFGSHLIVSLELNDFTKLFI